MLLVQPRVASEEVATIECPLAVRPSDGALRAFQFPCASLGHDRGDVFGKTVDRFVYLVVQVLTGRSHRVLVGSVHSAGKFGTPKNKLWVFDEVFVDVNSLLSALSLELYLSRVEESLCQLRRLLPNGPFLEKDNIGDNLSVGDVRERIVRKSHGTDEVGRLGDLLANLF